MIVVADTSPLNYLILIDETELLPLLFGAVLIPEAVLDELQYDAAPLKVRQWAAHLPSWLEVRRGATTGGPDELAKLDRGERDAILLALELGLNTVLLDESKGRAVAEMFHLEVRGTLGVLERGARLGHTNFRESLRKLEATNFRMSPSVRMAFLQRNP